MIAVFLTARHMEAWMAILNDKRWLLTMFALSTVGFFVALAVHFSTYIGFHLLRTNPEIMWLHVLVFPPFLTALKIMNDVKKKREASGMPGAAEPKSGKRNDAFDQLFPFGAPQWAKKALSVAGFYALVNFIVFIIFIPATPLSGGGEDGKYRAKNRHGTFEVTEEEYYSYRNWELRGFSGHWMMFYLTPSLGLGVYLARRGKGEHSRDAG
jgi:hypothetical protein